MSHKLFKPQVLAALILATLLATPASGEELFEIFPGDVSSGQVHQIDIVDLARILDYGIERELMIFEVFNTVALYMADQGSRAHISGETLREATLLYDLGGDRVEALLPVSKVTAVSMGRDGEGVSLDVVLTEKHVTSLENEARSILDQAKIKLAERYGFENIAVDNFGGGYGVNVKRLVLGVKMESLEIYAKNKIAIHVRGFSRVKRWRIRRLVRKPQAEAG